MSKMLWLCSAGWTGLQLAMVPSVPAQGNPLSLPDAM